MPTFNKSKLNNLKLIDNVLRMLYSLRKKKLDNCLEFNNYTENPNIIILLFLLIGDTVMYLPALKVLKKRFPNSNFTFVCTKAAKEILNNVEFEADFILIDCPWISPFNKSFTNRFKFWKSILFINKKHYDLAIDFRGDWRNIFYMSFINARRKVSYNFTGGEYMLTDSIIPNPSIKHFTDEALYLVKQIGCNFSGDDEIPIFILNDLNQRYITHFKNQNELTDKFIIGIHPGSSQAVKQWDALKFYQLIETIWKKKIDCKFLIFEGPGEAGTVNLIIEKINDINIPYCRIKKDFKEYINIMALCDIVICNDSGAAHIAAAHGKPLIIIFGNTNPEYVTPKSRNIVKVISHELNCKPCFKSFCYLNTNECIRSITVDEVLSAFDEMFIDLNGNINYAIQNQMGY